MHNIIRRRRQIISMEGNVWHPVRFPSGSDRSTIYKMLIDGEWVESSDRQTFDVKDPYDGGLVARVQKATPDDANRAVEAAWKARASMAGMDAVDRIELLRRIADNVKEHKDELVEVLIREAGKPAHFSDGEVDATIQRLQLAAEEIRAMEGKYIPGSLVPKSANKFAIVTRKPLGVVLAISPFNYPLFISISKIAPALASGNAVVCKAASDDPVALLMFARLAELAGVPKGGLNVITGGGGQIGDLLASHPKVGMISFTGSTTVGQHIAKVAGMKRMHLELGGKGPAIVLEDADLDIAVKECAAGALKYSGQRCDALSRLLVAEKVANDFVKRMAAEVKENYKMGNPADHGVMIGPMINQSALEKVESLVNDAVGKGAKVVMGGKRGKGLFFEPTILDRVTPDMKIAWEETFGPVVTIMRVKDESEAIELANRSAYGLDASVFTRDVDRAVRIAAVLEDGSVTINASPAHGVGNFPFGGDKDSGMGREGIGYSMDEMTKLHTIVFSLKK
jgi:glyceraldehyde-3-phosphate dehydrogenase (NADP+)